MGDKQNQHKHHGMFAIEYFAGQDQSRYRYSIQPRQR
jgi:hypothetical protein